MAKSIEDRIRVLEDREEIKELTARYCWHVSRGEGAEVAALFADDGLLEMPGTNFKAVRGRAALDEFYKTSVREPEAAIPFIQNHIIEVEGDNAHGTCAIEARFARNGESVTAAGYYRDKYRRTSGKWRFLERVIFFHHVVPLKQGWAEAKGTARSVQPAR